MKEYKRKICEVENRKIEYIYTLAKKIKNSKNGSAIVLFSGAGSDSFDWLPFIEKLSVFHNCLVVDKPGYFATTTSRKDFQEQIVEDVLYIAQKQHLKKVFLVGHSIGFLSALLFYNKYKSRIEIAGICSLDGIVLDESTVKLFKEMSAPKWLQFFQKLLVLVFGFFRDSLALNLDAYSSEFDTFINYYKQDVQGYRKSKSHAKAIMDENEFLFNRVEKYLFLKKEKLSTPFIMIKAIEEAGIEDSNELKIFPHLKDLILEVELKGDEWISQLIEETNGKREQVVASHFLHGESPDLVARYLLEFIENNTPFNHG